MAVSRFIAGRLPWIKIADVVGKTLEAVDARDPQTLDDILDDDGEARAKAAEIAEAVAR